MSDSRRRRIFVLSAIGALSCSAPTAAFLTPGRRITASSGKSRTRTKTSLQMVEGNLAGKVVYQRFLYKLSPFSDFPETPYTIEERLRFQVGDDGRELTPIGHKTFILRDGPDDDDDALPPVDASEPQKRVGKILYKESFHEITESESGAESYAANARGTIDDVGIASALYFAAQPQLVRGNVLELSSGVGFGGIMSCVAAGAAMPKPSYEINPLDDDDEGSTDGEGSGGDDDILPSKDKTPLPLYLEKLTLSDSNEEILNECSKNTRICGIPSDKIGLGLLDWNMPVKKEMKNQFDLILGNDIAYQFPDVKGISRLAAYCLKANPYVGEAIERDHLSGGQFVHVGPHTRDTISDLRKKLRSGYRMEVDVGYLELERFDLVPMILDSVKEEAAAEETLMSEDKGYVMYQSESKEKFTTFVATHCDGYDGFNGEYFFPAETGMEGEDKPSRWVGGGNIEKDDNYNKPEDPERGSWLTD